MEGNIELPEKEAKYKHKKINQKPIEFLTELNCLVLLPFAEEIYSYNYKDKPNYNKLRFLLTKEILNQDKVPNDVFDWNRHIKSRKPKAPRKKEEEKITFDSKEHYIPEKIDEY